MENIVEDIMIGADNMTVGANHLNMLSLSWHGAEGRRLVGQNGLLPTVVCTCNYLV